MGLGNSSVDNLLPPNVLPGNSSDVDEVVGVTGSSVTVGCAPTNPFMKVILKQFHNSSDSEVN